MKKLAAILLTLAMVLSLAACGGSNSTSDTSKEDVKTETSSGEATASNWPEEDITLWVAFAAGGTCDIIHRLVANYAQDELGVTVLVDNKTGANGSLAVNEVMNSSADGYTLVGATVGPCTIVPHLSNLGYTNEDMAPICQIADVPTGIAVRADSGIETMDDLIAAAKANPGVMTYGTSGASSIHNLAMEKLDKVCGDEDLFIHVPFDATLDAVTAMMGKKIDIVVGEISGLQAQYEAGEFNILCIASAERNPYFEEIPTLLELGYDVEASCWIGPIAPAGTPAEVIEKLDTAFYNALQNPDLQQSAKDAKITIAYLNHEDFSAKINKEYTENAEIYANLK